MPGTRRAFVTGSAAAMADVYAIAPGFLTRAISDRGPSGLAVHHACRMCLRAYESWNAGESATFFALTMEGLLLDKRQKDDLSARLQDSVAYWLRGSATDRERTRRCIADLYKVRSIMCTMERMRPRDSM